MFCWNFKLRCSDGFYGKWLAVESYAVPEVSISLITAEDAELLETFEDID